MEETRTREFETTGREARLVREALDRHEPKAPDVEQEEIETLERRFDVDVDDDETAAVEVSKADARVLIAALEEAEVRADRREEERLLSLREQFADAFAFEVRDVGDAGVPGVGYPGPTKTG